MQLTILLVFAVGVAQSKKRWSHKEGKLKTCDVTFCANGQECVESNNKPECRCIQSCYEEISYVCGSNRKTYNNKCELYKDACFKKESITLVATVSCEEDDKIKKDRSNEIEMDDSKPKPVVCIQKDRDTMRSVIINHFHQKTNLGDKSYMIELQNHYNAIDKNNDKSLEIHEFMNLVETKKLLSNVTSNSLLIGACIVEIMALTDDNFDYRLDFEEFVKCINPNFHPPHDSCELEGRNYDDGDDVLQECNTCKCACGKWICTSNICPKI
ncbi:follistatin-related protein 1 isoform X2 [Hydra vulgaris]|uniref:Follistatin-related protein 1 isoform X2 n=1 Tax=Hydra vulgaris TaxID=6087 RepID=A0ABM4B461_HYDVU